MEFPVARYGLIFRLVVEEDASFILGLRTDKKLGRYISHTDRTLEKQILWIKDYKLREATGKEYYILFEDTNKTPLGTFRLYNIDGDSCTAGSWLVKPDADEFTALKSDLFLITFGFEELKMKICFKDVRKENKKVVKYHKMFFRFINDDDKNFYMDMDIDAYKYKRKYLESILNIQL